MTAGTRIGQYELKHLLGSGGIGHVHAAVDTVLGRDVAFKSLRPELVSDKTFVERFKVEAVNLARLNHPNIATLYALINEGDALYMAMELVQGQTLEGILEARKSQLGVQESLAVILQAADGLAYAHEMGIIHRDIKPANIMVTETGRIKIMDFGIARARGSQRMTRDGSIVGTLAYISPEQLKGAEGDERSDLYSLAIVFYEMLTGKPPFEAATDYDLIQAHVNKQPPRPTLVVPDLPSPVEAALLKALAKKPEARFQSVNEFILALNAHDVRMNATSVIRSHHSLIQSSAKSSSTTSATVLKPGFKTRFLALPIEIRGMAVGGAAAALALMAIVIPPLMKGAPPEARLIPPSPVSAAPTQLSQMQPAVTAQLAPPTVSRAPNANFPLDLPNLSPPVPFTPPTLAVPIAPAPVATILPPVEADRNIAATSAPASGAVAAQSLPDPAPPRVAAVPAVKAEAGPTVSDLRRAIDNQNFGEAFTLGTKLAESGDAEAQFLLATLYRRGQGTASNPAMAGHWYEKAVDKGHARAAFLLGAMYDNGLLSGDRRYNDERAMRNYARGAELGDADSMLMVGNFHETGTGGVRRDRQLAIEYYKKAGDKGNAEAKNRLRRLGIQ